jgi:hypothetical protein
MLRTTISTSPSALRAACHPFLTEPTDAEKPTITDTVRQLSDQPPRLRLERDYPKEVLLWCSTSRPLQ